jgi:hypothetical protein
MIIKNNKNQIHNKNIDFLENLFNRKKFIFIDYNKKIKIEYFNSG